MLSRIIKEIVVIVQEILERTKQHRVSASAAHTAFFIMLSFIPFITLFFSMLQYTGIQKIDVLIFIQNTVPREMLTFFTGIIGEAYSKTATTISISALTALWSAGKGMMALTQGLQWISETRESRNYILVRIRAMLYTFVLMLVVIVFLLLGVFGNALMEMITVKFPITTYVINMIMDIKNIFLILFAIVIFTLIYRFMPGNEMSMAWHMPGAVITSVGWFVYSFAFSVYVDEFNGFSNMYGSLTTIVLIMLWLYYGMYITLVGAEVNRMLREIIVKFRKKT